jgi:hypothetical protein
MRLPRKSIARRTTRNDRLSFDRSSAPLRKGRRPASAGQRGFLKLQISHEKPRLIPFSLVTYHLPCPSKPPSSVALAEEDADGAKKDHSSLLQKNKNLQKNRRTDEY